MARFRILDSSSQTQALRVLSQLAVDATTDVRIVKAARAIVNSCPSRDDACELQAIYDAVKKGTPAVAALRNGLRYQADPVDIDFFTGPARLLEMCASGACGADCDEHAALIAALAGAVGFPAGLRAYGPEADVDEYVHVYAVCGYPKRRMAQVVGMDTTVPQADVGWEPPGGRVMTAALDSEMKDFFLAQKRRQK